MFLIYLDRCYIVNLNIYYIFKHNFKMPPSSILYSPKNVTHNVANNHANLITILSQTVTHIISTSKDYLSTAIIENSDIPENESIPEIIMTEKQETAFRQALIENLQTFMNKLHEHQSLIYLQYLQSLDTTNMFTLSSSAANIPTSDTHTNDTHLNIDSESPALNITPPNIPGVIPPRDYSRENFTHRRNLETERKRLEWMELQKKTNSEYTLQNEEDNIRSRSWNSHNTYPHNFHENQQHKWSNPAAEYWSRNSSPIPPYSYLDNTGSIVNEEVVASSSDSENTKHDMTEMFNDNCNVYNGSPTYRSTAMRHFNPILNDSIEQHDEDILHKSNSPTISDDENMQCCGRIGFIEYDISQHEPSFLKQYPHNVYISALGILVGDPCGNRIPVDEFYNENKVLCDSCMVAGVTNITENPDELVNATPDIHTPPQSYSPLYIS